MENPTVNFNLAADRLVEMGDLDNFKILYDKLESKLVHSNLAEHAIRKRQMGIIFCACCYI